MPSHVIRVHHTFIASLIGVALITGCQTPAERRAKRVEKAISERFDTLDTDHDGYLSLDEYARSKFAERSSDPEAAFKRADGDKDGRLSKAEVQDRLTSHIR